MARLLDLGVGPFLLAKLALGGFAAYVLYRAAHLAMARRGMRLVLGIYCALMIVHAATGFSALGWRAPEAALTYIGQLPHAVLTLFT